MRKLLFLLSFAVVFLSSENVSFAHPGGLDSNGGHTCRTNCAKWGLKDGQYHYHNPDGSISLTKPKPAPAPAPKPTPTPSTDIYYKDAVKQGDILQSELSQFNRAINSGNVYEIDKQYDDFTQQIKRTERAIGKVSGSTKRKELNNKYINNAKVAVERNIYEISQLRLVKKIDGLVKSNRVLEAQNEVAKLDRMKVRAADIKKAGGYAALPQGVYNGLFEQEKNMQLPLLEKAFSYLIKQSPAVILLR